MLPLCSGLLLHKYLLNFVFVASLLSLLPLSCAVELSVPSEIVLHSIQGEPLCTVVTGYFNGSDAIVVQDAWAVFPSRSLQEYVFSAQDAGIVIEYPPVVWLQSGKATVQFCIMSEQKGTYSGVILVRPSQSSFGAGTWITVNISAREEISREEEVRLSGVSTLSASGELLSVVSNFVITLFLLFFLGILLRKAARESEYYANH